MDEHAFPPRTSEHHDPQDGRPDGPRMAPALDYGAFRRMADWSAGMVDELVLFQYDAGGGLRTGLPVGEPRLQVPALTLEKPRQVASLRMAADGGEVELVGGTDAAFWSEAAVEKFLLPYYASLGAGRAAAVMAQLLGAWTEAPDGVQVMALTHFAHPPAPGATGIADGLGVVYAPAAGAPPVRATLSAFLAEYVPRLTGPVLSVPNPPAPAPRELPVPHGNGAVEAGYPSYLELRVMAEWSSSLRGQPAYFLFDAGKRPDPRDPYASFRPYSHLPNDTARKLVIPTYMEPLVRGRPAPGSMTIRALDVNGRAHDLAETADAVFWSSGAVEHLLIPYYAQVYGGQALRQVQALYDAWWHNRPEAEGATARVYAMLHLPNSDWAPSPTEEASYGVADVTGVLFAERSRPGETRVATLREFLRLHPR